MQRNEGDLEHLIRLNQNIHEQFCLNWVFKNIFSGSFLFHFSVFFVCENNQFGKRKVESELGTREPGFLNI